jgi:hypothetical protein
MAPALINRLSTNNWNLSVTNDTPILAFSITPRFLRNENVSPLIKDLVTTRSLASLFTLGAFIGSSADIDSHVGKPESIFSGSKFKVLHA